MELRLSPVTVPLVARSADASPAVESTTAGGFGAAFKSALDAVSSAQTQATSMQREVQMENPKVGLEETMVAIQKSQIGFQATLHVRNRMVQAYSDIMNMQV